MTHSLQLIEDDEELCKDKIIEDELVEEELGIVKVVEDELQVKTR